MTAPVWMAAPPEVHSSLLLAGPGPGSLLAAATQWQHLGLEYGAAATELAQLLAQVQVSSWEGPSSAQYAAAHAPYLAWLEHAAVASAVMAAQHQTIAAAYASALASMPSMVELAANHTAHGVLIATNFFGINTIPIAVNEANYARMWIQAAETMTVYQAVTEAATAAMPTLSPAPSILLPGAVTAATAQEVPDWLARLIKDFADFIADPFKYFLEFFEEIGFSPATAIALAVIAFVLYDLLFLPYYASYGLLLLPFFAPALSALSALSALALLQDIDFPFDFGAAPTAPNAAQQPRADVEAGIALSPSTAGSGSPQVNNPGAGAEASTTASAPASAPSVIYAVPGIAPPTVGAGPKAGAKSSDQVADEIAASAVAASSASVRGRRKRAVEHKAPARSYRHEFLTESASVEPFELPREDAASASGQGAGTLGFAGAAPKAMRRAATGMTQLSTDDRGQTMPLLPASWANEENDTAEQEWGTFRPAQPTITMPPQADEENDGTQREG